MSEPTRQPAFAQDPDELFDIVDAEGRSTGVIKRRADVHRDGDWHRSLHVWLIGSDPRVPSVIFQRRGRGKDTWPLKLDATVGGHFRTQETIVDVVREVEEEIGIDPDLAQMTHAGIRVSNEPAQSEYWDRELQEILLWPNHWTLTEFRPNPHELEALVEVPISNLTKLFKGLTSSVQCKTLRAETRTIEDCTVGLDDFIPTNDQYPLRIANAATRLVAGQAIDLI